MEIDKGHLQRVNKILKIIPKDVKTILNIGSRGNMFDGYNYKVTSLDVAENADIKQNLNINQKLDLSDNSFDIVIMDQILEHLVTCDEIIKEAKRVSKKYIYVGLPNEFVFSSRIKFLLGGKTTIAEGYNPFGHKHGFNIKIMEDFIMMFFGNYENKYYWFIGSGGLLIPLWLREILAKKFSSLFAGHVYYLIKT